MSFVHVCRISTKILADLILNLIEHSKQRKSTRTRGSLRGESRYRVAPWLDSGDRNTNTNSNIFTLRGFVPTTPSYTHGVRRRGAPRRASAWSRSCGPGPARAWFVSSGVGRFARARRGALHLGAPFRFTALSHTPRRASPLTAVQAGSWMPVHAIKTPAHRTSHRATGVCAPGCAHAHLATVHPGCKPSAGVMSARSVSPRRPALDLARRRHPLTDIHHASLSLWISVAVTSCQLSALNLTMLPSMPTRCPTTDEHALSCSSHTSSEPAALPLKARLSSTSS